MDFFEKNLNERFKDASSHEGVDANDLWSQIESEVSEKPSKPFLFSFWKNKYFLSLAVLLLIGAFAWYQLSDNSISTNTKKITSKKQIQNHSETIEKKVNNSEKINPVMEENSILQSENNSHTATNTQKPTIKNDNTNISNNAFTKNLNNENVSVTNKIKSSKTILKSNELTNHSAIENSNINSSNTITNLEAKKTPLKKHTLNQNNLSTKQADNSLTEQPTASETSKSSSTLYLEKLPPSPMISEKIIQEITSEQETENINDVIFPIGEPTASRFRVGVFAGVHTIKNIFSTNLAADEVRRDLLNNGFQYELGQTYSLELGYRLYNNIYFKSGIEYLQSKSEFNLVQAWDTTIVNPNSPVGQLTDGKAKRTVLHHNKMKYLSIPLMIAVQKSIGNRDLEMGVGVGVGLNFTSKQSGKSINSNNFIALYPSNENDALPVHNFFLSYQLKPYLNYRIRKNTFIQLRADIRYQSFGDSDFYGLKYSSILMGGGLGIEYKF